MAVEVLSNVTIPDEISQLPTSMLEQERFAYFYKDQVTGVFNKHYLEFLLARNAFEDDFRDLTVINVKEFSAYNARYGWEAGDRLLARIAEALVRCYPGTKIFRIHGDDFIVLSREDVPVEDVRKAFEKEGLELKITRYSILADALTDIASLERLLAG